MNGNEDMAVSPDDEECQPCDQGGDSGEATPSFGFRKPVLPSRKEIEDHERTHLPFRDWCKHCVMGRARNELHKKDSSQVGSVPRVSMDYMYMHEENVDKKMPEIVKGEGLPIIVTKVRADGESKGIVARVVPEKGYNEYAVKRTAQDLESMFGYKKMILKGDQEPALQVLMDSVGKLVGDQVIKENSPVGESQSNGDIESAVLQVQGLYRSFKSNLESDYGKKIRADHVALVWLLSALALVS